MARRDDPGHPDRRHHVDAEQHRREHPVDQDAADDHPDVEEPVTQDGDRHGDRQHDGRHLDHREDRRVRRRHEERHGGVQGERRTQHHAGDRDPEDLGADVVRRGPVPQDQASDGGG